jgi:hypothetical protein
MFQVFRIAFPSLCIPSTSVALQCHFPLDPTAGSPDLAIKRHAPTTGGKPDAAPNRRAWKQVSANGTRSTRAAGSQCSQPLSAEIYADVPTLCLDAPASAKSSLARAPHKNIPPRNAEALGGRFQQRSGVQTQFWSVPFIGDSLLQVNRNCRGRDVDAVERSLGKGEVISSILTGSTRMLSLARCSRRSWIASRCAAR